MNLAEEFTRLHEEWERADVRSAPHARHMFAMFCHENAEAIELALRSDNPFGTELASRTSALKALIGACDKYFTASLSSLGASHQSSIDIVREVREEVQSSIAAAKDALS